MKDCEIKIDYTFDCALWWYFTSESLEVTILLTWDWNSKDEYGLNWTSRIKSATESLKAMIHKAWEIENKLPLRMNWIFGCYLTLEPLEAMILLLKKHERLRLKNGTVELNFQDKSYIRIFGSYYFSTGWVRNKISFKLSGMKKWVNFTEL